MQPRRHGLSDVRFSAILVTATLGFVVVSLAFVNVIQTNRGSVQTSSTSSNGLPIMNQTTTVRQIWFEWYETQSGQDRFEPAFPVVNQGDTIALTLIDNDTVAQDRKSVV